MLQALVDLAQAQLVALFDRGGNLDVQALGLVGFEAALAAAIVAAQTLLGHLWWIPLPGLAISTAVGGSVLAVTRFDLGPSPGDFYTQNRTKADTVALAQLLADLLAAQERNAEPLRMKTGRLIISLVVLLVTVLYSIPLMAV
jgi:hypothetical protein